MEKEILTIRAKYDEKTIIRFTRDNMYANNSMWLMNVLALILIIYSIFGNFTDNNLFRILCGVIGAIWFIEYITIPIISAKNTLKKSKLSGLELKTTFFEDEVLVETFKDDELKSETRLKYTEIYKVRDLKKDIYIYISGKQAFCCDKAYISGDYEKLKSIFKEKVENYVCKCK